MATEDDKKRQQEAEDARILAAIKAEEDDKRDRKNLIADRQQNAGPGERLFVSDEATQQRVREAAGRPAPIPAPPPPPPSEPLTEATELNYVPAPYRSEPTVAVPGMGRGFTSTTAKRLTLMDKLNNEEAARRDALSPEQKAEEDRLKEEARRRREAELTAQRDRGRQLVPPGGNRGDDDAG